MYSIRAHQSNKWKRFFRSHLIEAWLLGLISLWGCFQTNQVKEDDGNVAYSSIIRPIDIDTSTAKEIGREALKKIGYNEIIKLSEQAGFIQHKADVRIQLASYESVTVAGFVPVFSRYAVAAAVASQADSPLPGPADIAAVGVVVIGLVDAGLLDGYLLSTVGEWLVGTRGTLLMSQARADDEERRGPSGKEGRGRGANRADGRMVDDAARHAGISDRTGFGKFIEAEKRATGRRGADNFTWDELLELAGQFKSQGAR